MIYNNRPFDIEESTDLFGTYFKADSIKKMFENNSNYFEQNNLIALYGEWGSGKTSVMEYINKSISNYNVLFFEAWRYEKDSNLALSLFEMLLDKFDSESGIEGAIIENAKLSGRTLLNMGKNILLNSKVKFPGLEFEIGKAGKDTIEQMERTIERTSFYTNLNDFDDSYNKLLNEYFEVTDKKLLVFIDDLDRCAPENVLDLISGIKHFFINSDKVVYFCGIDKNAVSRAIDIRYNHIVKSEDYLEKVFDVTFNMPEINDINNLLEDFISRVHLFGSVPYQALPILKDFLLQIKFTNPRKLKKLFNKYIFLCTLEKSNINGIYQFIPRNFNNHEPVQMLFTLFIILLYEFNRDIFETIYNNEIKIGKLKIILKSDKGFHYKTNHSTSISSFLNGTVDRWKSTGLYVSNDILDSYALPERDNRFIELLLLFSPLDRQMDLPSLNFTTEVKMYEQLNVFASEFQASEEKILSSFVSFLVTMFKRKDISENKIDFNVHKLLTMVNFYL
ncbi:KAP family P-loop NTPase fold protein [Peribacillus butanolivorans]|uniref:KAP NTPase domain-containing protein n=1 Tax=Peribacillus butanolivorans TaxID=421767 RepID=A0ABM6XM17_9BACI|nr:P-loop NTPase fold protein [Peribacillus butanolivorans]AXN39616.1 hypothetical protein DTO10_15410 [Peribacillus butanolivorans]